MTKGLGLSPQYIGQSPGLNSMHERDESYFDTEEITGGGNMSKISNHYEVPNMTSMLYEFTNKEQDRVHQGFRTGNYVSLRDLPTMVAPGNVSG